MSKKISISKKPTRKATTPDDWVKSRRKNEKTKRLTIDIQEDLHRKIKADCAMKGKKMADAIREILSEKFEG